jgi:hypothetical protein
MAFRLAAVVACRSLCQNGVRARRDSPINTGTSCYGVAAEEASAGYMQVNERIAGG